MRKRDQRSRKNKRNQRRAIVRKSVGGKGRELADTLYGPVPESVDHVSIVHSYMEKSLDEILKPFPENNQDENSGNA